MRKILIIFLIFIAGCATYTSQKKEFVVPAGEAEQAWSRAHVYLAQEYENRIDSKSPYVVFARTKSRDEDMTAMREYSNNMVKIVMIAGMYSINIDPRDNPDEKTVSKGEGKDKEELTPKEALIRRLKAFEIYIKTGRKVSTGEKKSPE